MLSNLSEPVEITIRKIENPPNVQATEQNILVKQDFCSSKTEVRDILEEATALNNKKSGTFSSILRKLLK